MKTYTTVAILCALLGCTAEHGSHAITANDTTDDTTVVQMEADASVPEPTPEPTPEPVPVPVPEPMMDAAVPTPPKPPKVKKPKPVTDAGTSDAGMDGGVDGGAMDSGTDGGHPTVDAGPPHSGGLRNLTVHLTGMDDDLHHFAQFRLANEARDFEIMFVIHEGLTSGTYEWELPNALFSDESYTLDFFIDHDEHTGPGFYDRPPVDHAWSIPIAEGEGDVTVDFPYNTDFTDIEAIAPTPFHSLILASSGMSEYAGELYDVRVIDLSTGRLVGRQLREIPGDSFDLTVGSTVHEGVEYEIDIAVDADGNGSYNHDHDPSWRLTATAGPDGLHLPIDSSAAQVDVGY